MLCYIIKINSHGKILVFPKEQKRSPQKSALLPFTFCNKGHSRVEFNKYIVIIIFWKWKLAWILDLRPAIAPAMSIVVVKSWLCRTRYEQVNMSSIFNSLARVKIGTKSSKMGEGFAVSTILMYERQLLHIISKIILDFVSLTNLAKLK